MSDPATLAQELLVALDAAADGPERVALAAAFIVEAQSAIVREAADALRQEGRGSYTLATRWLVERWLAERLETERDRARDALSDLVELMQIDRDELPEHIRDELPACERSLGSSSPR